jgi:ATP-dependent protease ClpP protease subunit
MKEIFLYSGIYDWTIEYLVAQLKEQDEPVKVRLNSGGGDVFAAQGFLADIRKRDKDTLAVDGNASSMAFFAMFYFKHVEILSTTNCLVHRANMYGATPEDLKMVREVNANYRKMMEAKLDIKKFEKVTGKTLDQIFNEETREEVWLNAQDLVEIGLVKQENVFELTPALAAKQQIKIELEAYKEPVNNNNNNNQILEAMADEKKELTAEERRSIVASGVASEKARVEAWMVWFETDPAKVKAGIESGKEISPKDTQEFVLAMSNGKALEAIKEKSPEAIKTGAEKTPEAEHEAELEKEEKALETALGLKVEDKK